MNEKFVFPSFAVLLLVGLTHAIWLDSAHRKISNKLCLGLFVAGVLMNGLLPAGAGAFTRGGGGLGWLDALLGAVGLLTLLWFAWRARLMGAGDVKLVAALGAWVGWQGAVPLLLFVMISGGVLALVRLCTLGNRVANDRVFSMNLQTLFFQWIAPDKGGSKLDLRCSSADRMPYAWAIAAGMLIYIFYSYKVL